MSHLQAKIRQDALNVIDNCETEDELDFLFPELTRIHTHDLAVLASWQNQVDWLRTLSLSELNLLESADFNIYELTANTELASDSIPQEQVCYESLYQKSHSLSLLDQLAMMFKSELRPEYENYITQQAAIAHHQSLVSSNIEKASNLTVANLYWYFKVRDESEDKLNPA